MIRVIGLDGNIVKVGFSHGLTGELAPHVAGDDLGGLRCTVCWINESPPDKENEVTMVGYGVAVCAEGDVFCKEVGRKIALERALWDTGWGKGERGVVWENYFRRGGK